MPIRYLEDRAIWILSTEKTAYVIGVDKEGGLQHLYWGDLLAVDDDYPAPTLALKDSSFESPRSMVAEEYPAWGGVKYTEPALKVSFADGVRSLILVYDGFEQKPGDISELIITLKDPHYHLKVDLHYKLHITSDIIERFAVILNQGTKTVEIEQIFSAVWALPRGTGYRLTYLAGSWAAETQLRRMEIQEGKFVMESRRGFTSPQMNPWFAIDPAERAGEEDGRVWFGALAWSGSWKIVIEQTSLQRPRISGGINDFDFSWLLEPGEEFVAPVFVGGFTMGGFGAASRNLHRYQLEYLLPKSSRHCLRQVLYNSWEATKFNVSEEGQSRLAEKAACLGVELFVIDDGWFGARNSDHAGLGDWFPNPDKFPSGLAPIVRKVNELGMDFGLWVEPEMVNPDSNLYREHPDWVYHFPNRPRTEARNQLILNLSRCDVQEYIFDCLDRLLTQNNIRFLKWDANRNFSEPGWPDAPLGRDREIWVRHVQGIYRIIDRLREHHEDVLIETCSGGGGRIDLGILQRTDQAWPSDNTDAFDRLRIHEGFSYAYSPKTMVAWVTDAPNFINKRSVSLVYRFHSAMMGNLGIGGNLNAWTEDELELAGRKIAEYKEVRHLVQEGRLYRLLSPSSENMAAFQYVSPDQRQSVVFVFLHSQQFRTQFQPVRLRGLLANGIYHVTGMNGGEEMIRFSGKALASIGIQLAMKGDFDSRLIKIELVNKT